MLELRRFTGDNYGGFWRFRVAKVAFSAVQIQRNQSVVAQDLAHLFSEIQFTQGSGRYRFDLRQQPAGASFFNTVSFDVPKYRREVTDWINPLKNYRFVVLLDTFTSGQVVVGDLEHPLKFTTKYDGGDEVKKFNHYEFTFQGDSLHPGISYHDALADFDPKDFESIDFPTP